MLCYIVLNYNDYKTTISYINKIKDYSSIDKIIVVDNCSTDNSYSMLKNSENDKIDVIKASRNGGYGSGNNYGVKYAKDKYNPEYVVISNPDVIIGSETVANCIRFLDDNPNVTVAVPLMLDKERNKVLRCVWRIPSYSQYLMFSLLFVGKIIKGFFYKDEDFEKGTPFACDCVAGSWLLIRTDDFIDVGMYDENIFLFCEETVLGIRLREHGYISYILPNETFVHNHSVSISKSFKSAYKIEAQMWKSRVYVLDMYYSKSGFTKLINRIISQIALLEYRLIVGARYVRSRLIMMK